MELTSIALARVVAMIQLQQWDPFGKSLTLEALARLGDRYSFTKRPTKLDELDLQKGIELIEGKFGDIRVDKISLFLNGIIIDTRSSTDDSEKVLADILAMAQESFGAKIKPARRTFTSQLIFQSDMHLAELNPILPKVANLLTKRVSVDLAHPFAFQPTAILLNVDTSQAKMAPAIFSIERRAEVPFAENTFFSSAPLRTGEHIEIVKAFEASLLA